MSIFSSQLYNAFMLKFGYFWIKDNEKFQIFSVKYRYFRSTFKKKSSIPVTGKLSMNLNQCILFVFLSIKEPWYFSGYAISIYLSVFLLFVFIYRKYLIDRERRRALYHFKDLETQRWKELDNIKSSFFANISHELRTPLTIIMSSLQHLMEKKNTVNDKPTLQMMYWNANRLLSMINQILDLSKLDAGKMKLRMSKIKIGELSEPILSSFQAVTYSSAKIFHYEINDPEVSLYCDVEKIERVINNLLSNAFKYTPDKGMISFRCRKISHLPEGVNITKADEYIEMAVFDNGKGIPKEIQDKIFERFFTHHQTFESSTGIGLSLTREFVTLHGGSIKVESEPNVFTAFYVYLPLVKHPLVEYEEVPINQLQRNIDFNSIEQESLTLHSASDQNDENKSLVLIIEDNRKLRHLIANLLRKSFGVVTASDGLQGLDLARQKIPDIIISDIMMPSLNGYELCNRLKNDLQTSHIPIILLTAKAAIEDKLKALNSGADDFITKPFNNKEIVLKVKNIINYRNQLKIRYRDFILGKEQMNAKSANDDKFLTSIRNILDEHYTDSDFTVDAFAQALCMSRVQLHRKIKALTNQSTSDFIRSYRLEKARTLIEKKELSIAQVAYQVGFSNPSYFTESFKKYYGMIPSNYLQ